MPTVRTYKSQQATAPVPGARKSRLPVGQVETPLIRTTPSAASFGAELGGTLAQAGSQFLGAELAAREQERAKQDDARVRQIVRKTQDWELLNIHDPKTGALTRIGQDAINLGAHVAEKWDTFVAEELGALGNERQRELAQPLLDQRRNQILLPVLRHEDQQSKLFRESELAATIGKYRDLARLNYQESPTVIDHIASAREATLALLVSQGAGPERIQGAVDAIESAIHRDVVEQWSAAGQDMTAKKYYETFSKVILPEDREALIRTLDLGSTRAESQREAARILATIRPDTKLSDLENLVDQITNPDIQDTVRPRVVSRFTVLKAEQQDDLRANAQAAKGIIDSIEQNITNWLRQNPGKMPMDGVPAALLNTLPRETQAALISFAKSVMPGEQKIETDVQTKYMLWHEASTDPAGFADRDLTARIHKLDTGDFDALMKLQYNIREGIRKGNQVEANRQLDDFRTETQIINHALAQLRIDPTPEAKTIQAAAVARFHEMVAKRATEFQRMTGEKPAKPDIQVIVDDLLRTVDIPGTFYGGARAVPLAFLRIGDIPAADRALIEEALRSENRPVNDRAILDLFIATRSRK